MTQDPNQLYGADYYKYYCGSGDYSRSEFWTGFFDRIAERVVNDFAPQSVLDAGCALGILVEALLKRGVDTFGFDISEFAIAQMPEEYAAAVKVGSILDPGVVARRFDVVFCIEVLEHLQPQEADTAVRNLCAWGDIVIFTSSPEDYKEVTHFNVQQPGYWVEKFAQNGFARVLDYDASYIAPWAMMFRRERLAFPIVARQYEDEMWQKTKEIAAIRQLVNQQQTDVAWYKNEFERLVSEIQARDTEINAQAVESASLRTQVTNLTGLLSEREAELTTLNAQMSALQSELARRVVVAPPAAPKDLAFVRRRSRELAYRARIVLREQGWLALTNRTLRWLGGERRTLGRAMQSTPTPGSAAPAPSFDPLADYPQWIAENEPGAAELEAQRRSADTFAYQPVITVLTPVYNTDIAMLTEMIDSVRAQTYPHWEFCLVDGNSSNPAVWETLQRYAAEDPRIKVQRLAQNLGISGNSNAAMALATGEFVALLDHDDTLAPFALYEMAKALNENPDLDFIYSDKDTMRQDGTRFLPLFKPQWSPEIMFNTNYLTHLCVLRTALMRQIGGFDPQSDGAQDWMLFLRAAALTKRFGHIPRVLYHWREHSRSTASGLQAKPYAAKGQLHAVQTYLDALHLPARARFDSESVIRVDWHLDPVVKVSVIIDVQPGTTALNLEQSLRAWLRDSPGMSIEWIVVDRGSASEQIAEAVGKLSFAPVTIVQSSNPSRAESLNTAAMQASGEVLVFLSAALSPANPNSLQQLVGWTQHPEIGVVGGQLLQPDGTIASIGQTLNLGGVVGALGAGLTLFSGTLLGHMVWYRNFSAISGDCMAIRRAEFTAAGGFDSEYQIRGWDVDICLRLLDKGLRHVYTPFAALSYSTSVQTFWAENDADAARLRLRHEKQFAAGDRFYNPNLALTHAVPRLRLRNPSAVQPAAASSPLSGRQVSTWSAYGEEASFLSGMYDFTPAQIEASQRAQAAHQGTVDIRSLTWFLPEFTNAFYGGVFTILRFAQEFQTRSGVQNHFVVFTSESAETMKGRVATAFPELAEARFSTLIDVEEVKRLPATDGGVCTLWTTAYALLRFNQTKRKFYFIQDMEPLFYPAGSTSGLVESSYRFGFYGLVNTPGLAQIYERDYHGQCKAFVPAINTQVFFPAPVPRAEQPPYRIFFYGRPGHPRNAFELGGAALRKLKRSMGRDVQIIAAGADWNPADYNLKGVVENWGVLKYAETGDLYRTCHAGFVMMFTRHPSYLPMELMACGALVITNHNEYTRWLLQDGVNCLLTDASASAIAERIQYGLESGALRQQITRTASEMVLRERSDWSREIAAIWDYMRNPGE